MNELAQLADSKSHVNGLPRLISLSILIYAGEIKIRAMFT